MSYKILASFLLLWLMLAPVVVQPVVAQEDDLLQSSIQENTQKLANLRARMKEQQQRMASLDDQAVAVRRSNADIQKEIETSRQLMSDMINSELQLTTQSAQLAGDVEQRKSDYAAQKQALAQSLRQMYIDRKSVV